jgi:valyl-tRNA synthetase
MAGQIDKDAETARLSKEIAKIDSNLQKSKAKLDNPNFADKAPEAVVQKERGRVAEMENAIKQLQEQLDKISAL